MQAFPFDIYFQYVTPFFKGIILGEEVETAKDAVIHEKDLKSHIYGLGKTGAGKTG